MYEQPSMKDPPKYPVRTVLNNRTISIFGAEDFSSIYKSWNLKTLVLKRLPESAGPNANECFYLVDTMDATKK